MKKALLGIPSSNAWFTSRKDLQLSEETVACTIHDAVANEPEGDGSHAEVHQILEQYVGVLCLREKPASTRRKPVCMKKTSTAANNTQKVLSAYVVVIVSIVRFVFIIL